MSEDIFKKNINNKLENLEIEPPQELWLNIEKEIDRSTRKTRILYVSLIGFAASLLVAAALNYTLQQEEININYQIRYSSLIDESEPIIQEHLYAEYTPTININTNKTTKRIKERKDLTPLKNSKGLYNELKNIIKKEYIPHSINPYEIYKINNNAREKSKKKKIQLGFRMASSNNSYSSTPPLNDNIPLTTLKNNNSNIKQDVPKSEVNLHTNINLTIEYPLSERLSLSSGIGYLGFSNKRNKDFSYSEIEKLFLDDKFLKEYNETDINKITQNFSFLEIPILLKYTLINKKISLFATAGVGIDFLIRNKSDIIFDNKHEISTQAKNILKVPTCSIIGIGLSTSIYKSLYINAEAQYRYYIKNISNNEAISIKQSMFNISVGLSVKI